MFKSGNTKTDEKTFSESSDFTCHKWNGSDCKVNLLEPLINQSPGNRRGINGSLFGLLGIIFVIVCILLMIYLSWNSSVTRFQSQNFRISTPPGWKVDSDTAWVLKHSSVFRLTATGKDQFCTLSSYPDVSSEELSGQVIPDWKDHPWSIQVEVYDSLEDFVKRRSEGDSQLVSTLQDWIVSSRYYSHLQRIAGTTSFFGYFNKELLFEKNGMIYAIKWNCDTEEEKKLVRSFTFLDSGESFADQNLDRPSDQAGKWVPYQNQEMGVNFFLPEDWVAVENKNEIKIMEQSDKDLADIGFFQNDQDDYEIRITRIERDSLLSFKRLFPESETVLVNDFMNDLDRWFFWFSTRQRDLGNIIPLDGQKAYIIPDDRDRSTPRNKQIFVQGNNGSFFLIQIHYPWKIVASILGSMEFSGSRSKQNIKEGPVHIRSDVMDFELDVPIGWQYDPVGEQNGIIRLESEQENPNITCPELPTGFSFKKQLFISLYTLAMSPYGGGYLSQPTDEGRFNYQGKKSVASQEFLFGYQYYKDFRQAKDAVGTLYIVPTPTPGHPKWYEFRAPCTEKFDEEMMSIIDSFKLFPHSISVLPVP